MSPSHKHLCSDGLLRVRQQQMEHAVLIDKALSYYPYWCRNSRTGHRSGEPSTRSSTLAKRQSCMGFDAYETREMQLQSAFIDSSTHSFIWQTPADGPLCWTLQIQEWAREKWFLPSCNQDYLKEKNSRNVKEKNIILVFKKGRGKNFEIWLACLPLAWRLL